MFGTARVLRFAVSLTIAMSTLSVAAQDTPVDTGSKAPGTAAQPAATDTAALAKATQNPVASLISVPLQNNSNFGIGPYNRTGDIFNIQPVIPMKLSEKVMLITRIIQPLVLQPYPRGDWERRSRGHMDSAVRRRRRPNKAVRISANQLDPAVLRERNPSARRFTV